MHKYTFVNGDKTIDIKTDRKMTESQIAKYERCIGKLKEFTGESLPKVTAQQDL